MFNNDIGKVLLFFETIRFGAKMKWLVWTFLLAVFIAVVLNSPYQALYFSNQCGSAFAGTSQDSDTADAKNNPNRALIDEIDRIDKNYQQKIKYAIIITFAVLFIAGVYWWTYGKLHHKLPRY